MIRMRHELIGPDPKRLVVVLSPPETFEEVEDSSHTFDVCEVSAEGRAKLDSRLVSTET